MEKIVMYNSLTRQKEEFKPMRPGKINMFVCGSTVYDDAHLGHAKTYIDFAVIVRWLRHIGYKVRYVQNITDVDDKIIERAREKGMGAIELARLYEKRLFEDMDRLGIKQDADEYPRSHDYIDAIREQIQLLLDKGYAYYLDGDIYYEVDKFDGYTKLSGMKVDELEKHRVEPREGKKKLYDFALWKNSGAEEEPFWEIGVNAGGKEIRLRGRPGWHIEDTAMTYTVFGPQYDIHGGANELIFPHHTNEIAQAEAAFGIKPFVRYWLHSGVLNVEGKKMSKSLHNFITIRDFLANHDPELLKIIVVSTHYRKELNYTEQLASNAYNRLSYLYEAMGAFYNMRESSGNGGGAAEAEAKKTIETFEKEFGDAMNDDFNTSLALTSLASAAGGLKRIAEAHGSIQKEARLEIVDRFTRLADVFGILSRDKFAEPLPKELQEMIKRREELRSKGNYAEADGLRDELREKGIKVEDTEYGTAWYKLA